MTASPDMAATLASIESSMQALKLSAEDFDRMTRRLVQREDHAKRLLIARQVAEQHIGDVGLPLVEVLCIDCQRPTWNITARCDAHQVIHPCQSIEWDDGEYGPCRRIDTYHAGVGVWLCPIHANTHRRHG